MNREPYSYRVYDGCDELLITQTTDYDHARTLADLHNGYVLTDDEHRRELYSA